MDETTSIPVSIGKGEVVYTDRNQTIQKIVAHFKGFEKEYFVSDHGERVALIVVKDMTILFVRQYRLLINDISCEIPGGRANSNETLEEAAIRECQEETGIQGNKPKLLIHYQAGVDIWKNPTSIFYCQDSTEIDEEKADRRIWMPLSTCIEKIFSGQITDSLSIIAILAYVNRQEN